MSDYINNIEKKPNSKKDVLISFLVIIAVFLFVFLFVTIREHGTDNIIEIIIAPTEEEEAEELTEEEILDEDVDIMDEEEIEKDEEELDRTEKEEQNSNRTKEVQGEESVMSYYRITAEKGEGLTHIARTALNKHLSDNNVNLSAEQKVYAEDYIQRRTQEERDGSDLVLLDEEVRIFYSHVEDAVAGAQNLTEYQINNLTQFVAGN